MWFSDEEYTFKQDVKEKKSIAQGARHKKNGSKSKKCNFPSDFLTKKEKKALNGECMSWNMKEFYKYADFKKMPDDIALQYINHLINRFNIGIGIIAEDVMGCTRQALKNNLRERDLEKYVNKSPSGGAASKGRIALAAAKSKAEKEKRAKEEPSETMDTPEKEEPYISVANPEPEPLSEPHIFANCHSMQVEMDDWDTDILDFLRNRFAGNRIRITITIDKES